MQYIIEHTGKYIQLRKTNGWEWVSRMSDLDIVAIMPITKENKVILIEQFRIPVDKKVIEFPAGLVDEGEEIRKAGERELMEETGYTSQEWTSLYRFVPSSAGLTNETVSGFLAENCVKKGEGGGIEQEDITVHEVDISDISKFLLEKEKEGKMIDPKIGTALYWYSVVVNEREK